MAFAALNAVAYVPTPSVTFYIDPNYRVLNSNMANAEIDFGDGNGFVPLPQDSITVIYPNFGAYTLILRINDGCNGSECLTASTKVIIVQAFPPSETIVLPQTVNSCVVPIPEGIGEGLAHVYLRKDSMQQIIDLHKPLIIVEGFESKPGATVTNDFCNYYGCGNLNWATLSSGTFGLEGTPMDSIKQFIDSLRYDGYDVIVLDLKTNRASVEKNGNLLINLIQYVNNRLQNNGSQEELIVMGASMGGLIARYGVRKMEIVECCHNTRLFATFSSPHKGANIPPGLQQFLYHLGHGQNPLGKGDDAKKTYDMVLNSPVARQMLVYHRDGTAAIERANFQSMLDSIGLPQECRIVALTNGSETALGQNEKGVFLQPNGKLLSTDISALAPGFIPDIVMPVLEIGRIINGNFNSGNFSMVYSEAYALKKALQHIQF